MYYLKLYDTTLVTFELHMLDFQWHATDINIMYHDLSLFPEIMQKNVNDCSIVSFLESRVIPKNRAFVHEILETNGLNRKDIKGIIDVCKGLSLTDSYWVSEDDNMKFDDYNLFDNEFSDILSQVAFTGYTSKLEGIVSSPEYTTNGALPKAWRRINGCVYLYKGGTDRKLYSNGGNEPYSEYYVSQIEDKMNLNHVSYDIEKWHGILASVCSLFTSRDVSYVPMYLAAETENIGEAWNWCKKNGFAESFADMIMLDALIYNGDRHFNNFGVLKDNHTGEYISFAPIFDNGEGLLSKASDLAFKDIESLNEYIKRNRYDMSAYGFSYNELVGSICNMKQVAKLRKMIGFKFYENPLNNLDRKRLSLLNELIIKRAAELIRIIENPSLARKEDNTEVHKWKKLYPTGTVIRCKELGNEEGIVETIEKEGLIIRLTDGSYFTVNPEKDCFEVIKNRS